MRYPGCQKAKAFKLFNQGKRPSEIYNQVKVIRHTLYNYYQLWKREREEESERKRLADQRQRKLEEEMRKQSMAHNIRAQQRIQLEIEYKNQMKRVLEVGVQMSRAADKPNNISEIERIGSIYSQEYKKFRELTRKLYPLQADEKSIEMALHPKPE